jgi:hypothetical protein
VESKSTPDSQSLFRILIGVPVLVLVRVLIAY